MNREAALEYRVRTGPVTAQVLLAALGIVAFSLSGWALLKTVDQGEKSAVNTTKIEATECRMATFDGKIDRVEGKVDKISDKLNALWERLK